MNDASKRRLSDDEFDLVSHPDFYDDEEYEAAIRDSTLVRRRLLHIDLTKVSLHQGFLVVACLRKRQRRTEMLRAFLCAMDMAHPISLRP